MFIGILINSQNFDFKNQILHDVISYKQFLWHRHSGYGKRYYNIKVMHSNPRKYSRLNLFLNFLWVD